MRYYSFRLLAAHIGGLCAVCVFAINTSAQTACTNAVDINVKSEEGDCFTSYTTMGTTDVGDRFNSSCLNNDDDAWWGKFTATETLTKFYLWGKEGDGTKMVVYSGSCTALNPEQCFDVTNKKIPNYWDMPTIPGTTYYILFHGKVTYGRLCVYSSDPNEPDKPFCQNDMSFENGTGSGWEGTFGPYSTSAGWNTYKPGTWNSAKFELTSGNGCDPNVGCMLPVVAPGGGNYSFRIGTVGTSEQDDNNYAAAASMSFCFTVNPQNAGFGYKYAVIMDYVAHLAWQQPEFQVFVEDACSGANIIPCGNFIHQPNDGVSPFHFVGDDTDVQSASDGLIFTPWTDVAMDLTGYIGKQVRVTFRVKDCSGGSGSGGATCSSQADNCQGGTHWTYTYFDTYCFPLDIEVPEFCAGSGSIQICAPEGFLTYDWPANQPGIQPPLNQRCVTILNPVGGTSYTVNMTSITGCPTSTTVDLKEIPLTSTDDTTMCPGNIDIFVNVTGTDGPYTYIWSPGGQTTASFNEYVSTTTTYTVTVTSASGCTTVEDITINIECGVNITVTGDEVCSGECGTITTTPVGGTQPYTYAWSPASAGLSGPGPHNVCPAATTRYYVTITDNTGATDTASALVIINNPPVLTVSPDQTICPDLTPTVNLNVGASGNNPYTYQWASNPPGFNSTSANPTVSPTVTTTYLVTVTDAKGCTSTEDITIIVSCLPLVTLTPDTLCLGECTSLQATGSSGETPYTFAWDNGITSTTAGPHQVCPTATTTYRVTLTDSKGDTATATTTVVVNNPPTLSTTSTNATCGQNDGSVTVNSTGNNPFTYIWSSNTGNQTGTTATGLGAGTYTVTVTDAFGCVSVITGNVSNLGAPTAQMTDSTDVSCFGACDGSATVTANGGNPPYTYQWDDPASQTTATATGLCAGSHNVCVTDNIGCKVCVGVTIQEPTAVVLTTSFVDESCSQSNGSVAVTASGGTPGYTYLWDDPAGQTTATATGLAAGTYCVTVTDAQGCSANICRDIINIPAPVPQFTGSPVCVGDSTAFTYGSTGNIATCSWDFGDGITSTTCANVKHKYQNSGTYVIQHCVTDAGGCQACITDSVTVYPIPVVCFSDSLKGCVPLTASFVNCSTGGDTYLWEFGDGTTSDQANPTHVYSVAGCYDVTLTVTSPAGCQSSDAKDCYIEGYPIPDADFIAQPWEVTVLNPFIQFTDKSTNGVAWFWDFGDGGTSVDANPTHIYADTGCYVVNLYMENQYGCRDSVARQVCVKDIFSFYIPNAFTPNNDGANEWFTIGEYGMCDFEMMIFDRWGNLIYETTSLKGWDGTANGGSEIVQEDVYVWKIKVTDCYGEVYHRIGHVTLVR